MNLTCVIKLEGSYITAYLPQTNVSHDYVLHLEYMKQYRLILSFLTTPSFWEHIVNFLHICCFKTETQLFLITEQNNAVKLVSDYFKYKKQKKWDSNPLDNPPKTTTRYTTNWYTTNCKREFYSFYLPLTVKTFSFSLIESSSISEHCFDFVHTFQILIKQSWAQLAKNRSSPIWLKKKINLKKPYFHCIK